MLSLFTTGIVSAQPSPAFTLAVLCGAATWILIATWTQLPVSTTHAIIGSLFGAGIIFSPNQLIWTGALPKFALPLLLSIAAAYLFSAVLNRLFARKVSESVDCVCVGVEAMDAGSTQFMQFNVVSAPSAECENAAGYLKLNPEALHWLSSGSVGFARGLNDTPKLGCNRGNTSGTHQHQRAGSDDLDVNVCRQSLCRTESRASISEESSTHGSYGGSACQSFNCATGWSRRKSWSADVDHTRIDGCYCWYRWQSDSAFEQTYGARPADGAWTVTPFAAGIIAVGTYLILAQM